MEPSPLLELLLLAHRPVRPMRLLNCRPTAEVHLLQVRPLVQGRECHVRVAHYELGISSEAWTEHTLIWQGLEPHYKVLLATAHTDEGSHHELFLAFDNLFDGMAGSEQRPSRLCRWNAVHPQARRGGEHGRAHLRVHVWPIGHLAKATCQPIKTCFFCLASLHCRCQMSYW